MVGGTLPFAIWDTRKEVRLTTVCENPCAHFGLAAEADLGIFTIVLKIFVELPPDKLVCIARYRCGTAAFSVYRSALCKYEDGGLAFINIGHQWL
jgi:hypothetical protein